MEFLSCVIESEAEETYEPIGKRIEFDIQNFQSEQLILYRHLKIALLSIMEVHSWQIAFWPRK